MIVYRVEGRSYGRAWEGVYHSGTSMYLEPLTEEGWPEYVRRHPLPEKDGGELRLLAAIQGSNFKHMLFGFAGQSQLDGWFPEWRRTVAEHPDQVRVRAMRVHDDCVIAGEHQVVFDPAAIKSEMVLAV